MFEPKNEQGVVALFMMGLSKSKWEVSEIGMPFPDAILLMDNEVWKVEFEYLASNFVAHGHDYRECDLIICWRNDLQDCPLPVLALSDPSWEKRKPIKGNPLASEIQFWKSRVAKLEREMSKLKIKGKRLNYDKPVLDYYRDSPLASEREAARETGLSQSTVNRTLNRLEASGIIHRNGNGVEILKG